MAAMIWDTEAHAYKNADTPMIYDPASGAWTETTGLAWDMESEAWTERWNNGVRAYMYGAALETVTIRKNGIIVATVQTDASGCSTEMVSLSPGTYTLTGSVSGWTEEQIVGENTDRYRAMPDGSIYWYGNEVIPITPLSVATGGSVANYTVLPEITKNSQSITVKTTCSASDPNWTGSILFDKYIDFSKYEKIKISTKNRTNNISLIATNVENLSANYECEISSGISTDDGTIDIASINETLRIVIQHSALCTNRGGTGVGTYVLNSLYLE